MGITFERATHSESVKATLEKDGGGGMFGRGHIKGRQWGGEVEQGHRGQTTFVLVK